MSRVVASFGNAGGPGNLGDSAVIGEAMWAGIPDGTAINPRVMQKSLVKKFCSGPMPQGGFAMVPLINPSIDDMIKSAILDPNTSYMQKSECEETYAKNVEKINKEISDYADELLKKADNTVTSNFMHVIADESVTYLYKAPYPFQALLPVEANKGKTALWDMVGPYNFTSAAFGSEDPDLQEVDMESAQRTDTIKYMYAVGRLTKAVKLAGMAQVPARDMKAIRVDMAQEAVRALRERAMLGVTRDVSSVTNEFVPAGPLEYKGVYEQVHASTKGIFIDGGGAIDTYGEIMKALDDTYAKMVLYKMQPNLAVCDYKTFGIIRRGLAEYFRYEGEPVKTLVPGVSKIDLVFPNQGGLALMPHPYLSMVAGNNGCIQLLDTRLFARRTLWMDTYEELANINTSDKFVISSSETLIDKSAASATTSLHGGVFGITIA